MVGHMVHVISLLEIMDRGEENFVCTSYKTEHKMTSQSDVEVLKIQGFEQVHITKINQTIEILSGTFF